ncbi:dihydrodipicolinate synthase family protein [Xylanibacillus composti]|uniref:4-hydroxy-tetrahydrodipicolinate synthase n=1 Tax=Xylanibacillus composti TaxID=1572762 RepID=A0A8J4H6S3_9BACL|nr:dihydrodipicolinate synthase family protein [Xylanibacillus composti]GIQ69954.1 4-hydroxy-tetrahydrodipicolinate synthase [Xylanibacillus composti]
MELQALQAAMKGIYVLAITPMREDGSLDLDALRSNIETYLEAGVHGVVVGGTFAEYPSMSMEERAALFAAAAEAVGGKVPLICCTAASGTPEAIALTKAAKAAGADGAMITPPYVAEVGHADIKRHFESIIEAVPFPIMIYNSTSIGLNLSPEQLAELAELDYVIGVKQANTDLHVQAKTMALAGDKMSILNGSDGVILGALALGMHGCTSTLANLIPGDYVSLYKLVERGELAAARKLYYSWQPIRDFCKKHGQPAAIKTAMEVAGLKAGAVRVPFRSLGSEAVEEFKVIWETYRKENEVHV